MDEDMKDFKTPYTGNAAARREHERLIRKGKAIATRIEADRMIRLTVAAHELAWDTPEQFPYPNVWKAIKELK
jgi:hypothetical protein